MDISAWGIPYLFDDQVSACTAPAVRPGASRRFATVDQAQAFLAGHFNAWRDCLPPEQHAGLRMYQSPDHVLINWQRRGHVPEIADQFALRACRDVSAAIAAAPPLAEPVVGFRGFSGSRFGSLTAGQRLTDRGFVSLSLTDDVHADQRAAGLATAAVHLPAGTRAAAVGTRELVLDGGEFEVLRAGQRRGVPHYELRLVG